MDFHKNKRLVFFLKSPLIKQKNYFCKKGQFFTSNKGDFFLLANFFFNMTFLPKKGDLINYKNISMNIIEADEKRILKVKIEKKERVVEDEKEDIDFNEKSEE